MNKSRRVERRRNEWIGVACFFVASKSDCQRIFIDQLPPIDFPSVCSLLVPALPPVTLGYHCPTPHPQRTRKCRPSLTPGAEASPSGSAPLPTFSRPSGSLSTCNVPCSRRSDSAYSLPTRDQQLNHCLTLCRPCKRKRTFVSPPVERTLQQQLRLTPLRTSLSQVRTMAV